MRLTQRPREKIFVFYGTTDAKIHNRKKYFALKCNKGAENESEKCVSFRFSHYNPLVEEHKSSTTNKANSKKANM